MVAFNTRYRDELAGSGRLGFVVTNGLHDVAVIDGEPEDEYRQRLREGWRIVFIRPICRSVDPKLEHTNPGLQGARAYSYTLIVLEHPAHAKIQAQSEAMRSANLPPAARREGLKG
jgi:hypothetical protein